MRITTWNIRAGGGRRYSQIVQALLEQRADLIVLTEYRTVPGERLLKPFIEQDYNQLTTTPPTNQNGVCVLSKHRLTEHNAKTPPESDHRWLTCQLPDFDLLLLAVHVPNQAERWNKQNFWECVEGFAAENIHRRCAILGDLNTALDIDCEGCPIPHAISFQRLLDAGWVDAWREHNPDSREFTWYSHRRNGFRLDHCLLSPSLSKSSRNASLRHDVRTERLSDHSLLTVELDDSLHGTSLRR